LFTVGNEVNILEKHDDGWWKAEIRGCMWRKSVELFSTLINWLLGDQ